MRNLKKILALVLALVMSLSLMATASAKTNFPDDGEITDIYRPAVEVLSGLNVFVGDQNGEFNPGDHIRRSEVAAIIYRIATGDVTNSQNDAYTPYNQFSDVIAGDWFAGYVTYCANAGYIKGRNDGKFDPYAEVTGYEVLAMILRAVGYDKNNEFVGSNWQLNTASIAQQKGVLGNITSTTKLSEAATRETVAELLFQSMLLPQVTWNAATLSYDANRPTLAKEHLDTEEVTGVVVANEYANLYDYSTLADGKTDLEVAEGDVRRLDWNDGDFAEGIKVIGKSRHAYIQNAKVLYMTDTDMNDVKDNDGAETTVNALRGGLDISNAEYYLNFDPNTRLYCEQRIEFNLRFTSRDPADTTKGLGKFTKETGVTWQMIEASMGEEIELTQEMKDAGIVLAYEKVIPANKPIYRYYDLKVMEAIFQVASDVKQTWGIDGSVYVGTRSGAATDVSNDKDVSNDISYATFEKEYILTENAAITEAGNGEWLQVIDNDGDGKAEYVMLLEYHLDRVMAEVKDGFYYYSLDTDWYTPTYLNGYTPAVGDYVLYACIDSKAQMHKAETATATFRAVNYKERQATDTDSTTWEQSDIWNHTELNEVLTDVNENVEYTLYLDEYGYVRATNNKSNYALVTEIYPTNNMNQAWLQTYDLTAEVMLAGDSSVKEYRMLNSYPNGTWNPFVVRDYDNNGSLDCWTPPILSNTFTNPNYNNQPNYLQPATHMLGVDRHEAADMFRYAADSEQRTHSWTNVAEYSLGENGINLFTAANFDGYYDNGAIVAGTNYKDYVQLKVQDVATNTKSLYLIEGDYSNSGTSAAHGGSYVRAVDDTIFYVVARDGGIHQYSLATLPSLTMETHNIHAMYAVASPLTTNDNYRDGSWVADVIVIEVEHDVAASWTSIGLIYSNNTKESTVVKCLEVLDSKLGYIQIVPTNVNIWNGQFTNYGFYKLYNVSDPDENGIRTAAIEKINNNENFNSYGIYYGRVRSQQAEMDRSKYITVDKMDQYGQWVDTTSIRLAADYGQAWAIDAHRNYNDAFTLALGSYGNNRVYKNDEIIWVESGAGTAGFIVDLTDTDWDFGVAYNRGYTTPGFLGGYDNNVYGDWYNIAESQWTYSGDINAAYTYEEIVYPITSSTTRASMPAYRNFVLTSYDLYVNGSTTAAEPVYSGIIGGCWHIRYNLPNDASVKVVVTPNTRASLKLNADFTSDGNGVLQPGSNTWNFIMPALNTGEKVVGTIRDTADPVKTPVAPGANDKPFETPGDITEDAAPVKDPVAVEVIVNDDVKDAVDYELDATEVIPGNSVKLTVTKKVEDAVYYVNATAGCAVTDNEDGTYTITANANATAVKVTISGEEIKDQEVTITNSSDGKVTVKTESPVKVENGKVTLEVEVAENYDVYVNGTKCTVVEGKITVDVAEGVNELVITAKSNVKPDETVTGQEPGATQNDDGTTYTVYWSTEDAKTSTSPNPTQEKVLEYLRRDCGNIFTADAKINEDSAARWETSPKSSIVVEVGGESLTVNLVRVYKITVEQDTGDIITYVKTGDTQGKVTGVKPGDYIEVTDDGKVGSSASAPSKVTVTANGDLGANSPTKDITYVPGVAIVFADVTVKNTSAKTPTALATGDFVPTDAVLSIEQTGTAKEGYYYGINVGETEKVAPEIAQSSTDLISCTYAVNMADVATEAPNTGKIVITLVAGYYVTVNGQPTDNKLHAPHATDTTLSSFPVEGIITEACKLVPVTSKAAHVSATGGGDVIDITVTPGSAGMATVVDDGSLGTSTLTKWDKYVENGVLNLVPAVLVKGTASTVKASYQYGTLPQMYVNANPYADPAERGTGVLDASNGVYVAVGATITFEAADDGAKRFVIKDNATPPNVIKADTNNEGTASTTAVATLTLTDKMVGKELTASFEEKVTTIPLSAFSATTNGTATDVLGTQSGLSSIGTATLLDGAVTGDGVDTATGKIQAGKLNFTVVIEPADGKYFDEANPPAITLADADKTKAIVSGISVEKNGKLYFDVTYTVS